MSIIARVLDYYSDREYFYEMRKIAIPIIIQQLMFSGLNMLSVVFVGQKGEVSVAAVGFAAQIAFLLNLVHFGIISGAAMFTAQFWGRRDIPNLRRVLGLCLILAISASLIFFVLAQFLPLQLLSIYSRDSAVTQLGAGYLRTFSWTFLFFAVTFSYALVMRSTGDVRTPGDGPEPNGDLTQGALVLQPLTERQASRNTAPRKPEVPLLEEHAVRSGRCHEVDVGGHDRPSLPGEDPRRADQAVEPRPLRQADPVW